jgi:CRP/FNR family cyclic AMP-dependent transcriptional regulator
MASGHSAKDLLQAVWLFSDLGDKELEELARVTVRCRYGAGEVVVEQGSGNRDLFVVVDGLLRVWVRGKDEREVGLNLLRRGDVCGELSLFDGRTRSATITAAQPAELLLVRRAEFLDAMRRAPDLSLKLLQSMAAHVRRLTERVEDLASLPVRQRLAKKLLEIADICGTLLGPNQVALPSSLSQQDLADHIQATRESVNKCLAAWARDDVVYRTHSQLVIRDRERLEQELRSSNELD